VILRSDVERKTLFGIDETERLPERAYSVETTIRVYKGLAEKARRVTCLRLFGHRRCGLRFACRAVRDCKISKRREFDGLFLVASLDDRLARVGNRGRDASDADADVARKQEEFDLGPRRMVEGRRIRYSRGDASARGGDA
jgi:predicted kinase